MKITTQQNVNERLQAVRTLCKHAQTLASRDVLSTDLCDALDDIDNELQTAIRLVQMLRAREAD